MHHVRGISDWVSRSVRVRVRPRVGVRVRVRELLWSRVRVRVTMC